MPAVAKNAEHKKGNSFGSHARNCRLFFLSEQASLLPKRQTHPIRDQRERDMAWTMPPNLIALEVSGDIGDLTFYRNKNHKTVAFPKDFRQENPSEKRLAQQERFRNAQSQWADLTAEQKNALEEACRQLSMPLTGQNLFISVALRGDFEAYQTVANQSGISLPPAPIYVP